VKHQYNSAHQGCSSYLSIEREFGTGWEIWTTCKGSLSSERSQIEIFILKIDAKSRLRLVVGQAVEIWVLWNYSSLYSTVFEMILNQIFNLNI